MKTIEMGVGDYLRALRPAFDGTIAMVFAVVALQWSLPLDLSPWFRLMVEIAGGAVTYVAAVALLHRQRAMHFLSVAKRIRRPKLAEAPVTGS